jgi:uncharacterized Ntn-hydrolase superfamily protein
MTYSIVARDPDTGVMGVAVQSHYFQVGSVVPWGEAGVGVVATQAMGEASYGPLGVGLLRVGKTPSEALLALTSVDKLASRRQVAMVDRSGAAAAHTGEFCIPHCGHRTGDGVSVQANMMERDTVPDAMLTAYTAATGDLTDRLLATLDAAEAEGGDIRGRQSAAILIIAAQPSGKPWADRLIDLRVEDHPEPNAELRRLVDLKRLYAANNTRGAATAHDSAEASLRAFEATSAITRGNPELLFWQAFQRALAGDVDGARTMLARCAEVDPRWPELLRRLEPAGMINDDTLVERLLAP